MEYFLEEEKELGNGKKHISKIKQVKDKAEAIKDKTNKKCFFHECFHDEIKPKPCKREVI